MAGGNVLDVVEQKAGTAEQLAIREANMGITVSRADLFWGSTSTRSSEQFPRRIYLTDMPAILTRAGHTVRRCASDDPARPLGIIRSRATRYGRCHLRERNGKN